MIFNKVISNSSTCHTNVVVQNPKQVIKIVSILISHKNKLNIAICGNIDGSRD